MPFILPRGQTVPTFTLLPSFFLCDFTVQWSLSVAFYSPVLRPSFLLLQLLPRKWHFQEVCLGLGSLEAELRCGLLRKAVITGGLLGAPCKGVKEEGKARGKLGQDVVSGEVPSA